MNQDSPLFIFGDIHGYYDNLVRQLRYAGLANSQAEWTGKDAQLWFMGDFTDRGPDGVGVIDFVMRLQQDAANKGGSVGALFGNHDVGILGAKLFPNAPSTGQEGTFYEDWVAYGGTKTDLPRLETHHMEWLRRLPAMAVVNERLLMHADAMFYLMYGETLAEVNAGTRAVLASNDSEKWDTLLSYAGQRFDFDERKAGGVMRASQMLAYFGGKQIIHGHTPIDKFTGEPVASITRPYIYSNNLAIDVDGGIYKGGPGFIYQVPPLEETLPAEQSQSKSSW